MGGCGNLRTLLDSGPSGPGLASVQQRPLGAHRSGMVLGQRRAMGLGHLSLWALGFQPGTWLVLGASDAMGARVGFVAPWRRLSGLGAVAAERDNRAIGCHRC